MSYKAITEVGRYIPKINNTKNISTNGYHMDIYGHIDILILKTFCNMKDLSQQQSCESDQAIFSCRLDSLLQFSRGFKSSTVLKQFHKGNNYFNSGKVSSTTEHVFSSTINFRLPLYFDIS